MALLVSSAFLYTQSALPDVGQTSAPPAPLVTVHGEVRNSVSGEPLPRVLVLVDGSPQAGVLTDGNGRFEIPGVPAGSTSIQLAKPGFEDEAGPSHSSIVWANNRGIPHSVTASEQMPDLEFAMRPLNAIRGQIVLSSGDSADKIMLELLGQSVMDGRLQWHIVTMTQTNADGDFRFGGLSDGTYVVATQPSIEGGVGALGAMGANAPAVRDGYAQVFYPDARGLSGAAKFNLAGGQTISANFTLKQEPFHLVRASVSGPGLTGAGASAGSGGAVFSIGGISGIQIGLNGVNAEVLDTAGHDLPYPAQYDAQTQSIQSMLPDGDYTLRVSAFRHKGSEGIVPAMTTAQLLQETLAGQTDVSVSGHPVTNARLAIGPMTTASLEVMVNHSGAGSTHDSAEDGPHSDTGIFISASVAGASVNTFETQFAQGSAPGPLNASPLTPGSYWLHTTVVQPGLCEASFTAGGAILAREPLVVRQGGSTAPLTLTLRDDCASLKIASSPSLYPPGSGNLPVYYVYVVPDFDSTTQIRPFAFSAMTGNPYAIENLTPGAYHVYTFSNSIDLPFRDPEAMAALNLQGQTVTLSPSASANLVLEVPAP